MPGSDLVLGPVILVQLGLQRFLRQLGFALPLARRLFGMLLGQMGLSARLRLLGRLLLTKHDQVPQLQPLQEAAVGVLRAGEKGGHVGQIQQEVATNGMCFRLFSL